MGADYPPLQGVTQISFRTRTMNELLAKTVSPTDGLAITARKAELTILVVDDHEDTRELLRYVFERQSYKVSEAADGAEAVAMAATIRPDVIVMDTTLRSMDGLEATRRIRRMNNIGNVPIVFLSGHAQPQARDLAMASGANEYLVKPVSVEELEIVVDRQISTRNAMAGEHFGNRKNPGRYCE